MTVLSPSPGQRDRYFRAQQIHAPDGLLPISRSKFFQLVREGHFAPPIKLAPRISAWRESDIQAFIKKAAEGQFC